MFLKMVKNDFIRQKIVSLSVFVFITMAVILAASAINNIANLSNRTFKSLFEDEGWTPILSVLTRFPLRRSECFSIIKKNTPFQYEFIVKNGRVICYLRKAVIRSSQRDKSTKIKDAVNVVTTPFLNRMENRGLEPLTSTLPALRSPS